MTLVYLIIGIEVCLHFDLYKYSMSTPILKLEIYVNLHYFLNLIEQPKLHMELEVSTILDLEEV